MASPNRSRASSFSPIFKYVYARSFRISTRCGAKADASEKRAMAES